MGKETKKFNIKDQLAGIAALIAAIVAIGGGFSKYGELKQKIKALELTAKKQTVVDTSGIESGIAVLEEKVTALTTLYKSIESQEETVIDISGIGKNKTKTLVNEKEIQLLKVQIEEIKISTSNPLAN